MNPALLVLLLPLSAIQGLWVKQRASRLPGAEGERNGVCGSGDNALSLLAIGDSIIDGVGTGHTVQSLPVSFARSLQARTQGAVHWRIEGRSGWSIDDLVNRLESLDDIDAPDCVLVSVGVNDVTGLTRRAHWRSRLRDFLDTCFDRWPRARVIFCGLPPMQVFPLLPQPLRNTLAHRAAVLDADAASVVGEYPRARHVPTEIHPERHEFCEDGFHPSAESCKLWAVELTRQYLERHN